ncbi:GEM-like protein 1 [Zingiber officinale]|uniref:GRAM domain-containing protein n=1 Tax=Zingiber officinale TaxID=94328 RepID=A0A8J5EXF5_ZINOF|nr:GEM-like protein 1 [Zingiber officinale]KAG6476469.1 hypothetical protein ZIOFF_065711 [Zingiber officinale]
MMITPVSPHSAAPPNGQAAVGWVPISYDTTPASHYPSNTIPGASNSRPGNNLHLGLSPSNPYVNASSVPTKSTTERILMVLDRCGRKLEDNTRKAAIIAGNVWQHLKTSPNITDAALTRLSQATKVFAEGGSDKVFQQTFGCFPGEQLWKVYACYLSTSTGPVIGMLYISTARVAFCSDHPLCYDSYNGQQQWAYYKVLLPLDQLKAVNPSTHKSNPLEKYIQIVTNDSHEFWFMGFISYDKVLKHLQEALHQSPHITQRHNSYH